jgi:hypothetical protein
MNHDRWLLSSVFVGPNPGIYRKRNEEKDREEERSKTAYKEKVKQYLQARANDLTSMKDTKYLEFVAFLHHADILFLRLVFVISSPFT